MANGRMMPEQQAKQWRMVHANYNQKEREFLKRHEGASLTELYLEDYGKRITDEYQPFGCGLDSLDAISLNELLARDGASPAAIESIGSTSSALHVIWKRRIVEMRGIPEEPKMFYRVKGGNEMLPLAMAERLGGRIWKDSPVTAIRRGDAGVSVTVRKNGKPQQVRGRLPGLRDERGDAAADPGDASLAGTEAICDCHSPVHGGDSADFSIALEVLERDGFSGDMEFNSPILGPLWPTADEVETTRGIMIGTAQASVTADAAMAVFRKYYPGHSADFEKTMAVDWSRDPWAMGCEARDYKPGQLRRLWPGGDSAGRAGVLRGRLLRQPELGHGGRDTLGLSRRARSIHDELAA